MKYTPGKLGDLIRSTRKQLGVTQEQLAMTAGTGIRFIIDLESGKPTCQVGKALAVMTALGIGITLTPPPAETRGYARTALREEPK